MKRLLFFLFIFSMMVGYSFAETYSPYDLKQFITVTYDTAYYPTLTDADSVQHFFRYNENTYYDTTLLASAQTGYFIRETNVTKWWGPDSVGSWGYITKAFYMLKTGGKSWSYKVKPDPLIRKNIKSIYVRPDDEAIVGGSGYTFAEGCSISTALARCTGADEYYIYVAPGLYSDVDINCTIGGVHWIGAGIGMTELWGKKDGALPSEFILRFATTDSSAGEVTGFEFRGYEATSGVEDSNTFRALQINEPTTGIHIHHNSFYNFDEAIYLCAATMDARIEHNWISKSTEKAIHLGGGGRHWISNNVIDSVASQRVGIYVASSGSNGFNVISNNIIDAPSGKAISATAPSKRCIFVNNSVRAMADSAFVDAGDNIFVNNHMQSQISDPQTLEEDLGAIEEYVDNLQPDSTLRLAGLNIVAADNDTAFVAKGSGSGFGAFIGGGATGHGFYALGGTAKYGIVGEGGSSAGIGIVGQGGASGGEGAGFYGGTGGTSTGMEILGANDGYGLSIQSGASGAYGVEIRSEQTAVEICGTVKDVNLTGSYKIHGGMTGYITGDSTMSDSVLSAITDANKANFKASGFATSTQGDSVTQAISDANKANFKATGFAIAGDAMTLQGDSLNTLMTDVDGIKTKTDNLPADPADDSDIDAQLNSIQIDLDNPSQYRATGFATSAQGDSMTNAIKDANKVNFMADLDSILNAIADANKANFMANVDSILEAIADANKANFKATGFATASDFDSINQAITDANKANFKATDFATSTQGDSITLAITDVNKANFKATGFAVAGDAMTLQADSLNTLMGDVDAVKAKTDNLPSDPADDSDIDAQLSSIQSDLDDPGQYKATGFATSTQGDSVTNAITDVNKANFKFGGGTDSVRAYLAKHDSTLLEQAAGGASNWSDAQRDSVLDAIEDANKANFKATGFATSTQGDSITQAISDANKANFRATGFATADSVHTAITDVNKANFKATGFATSAQADSVTNAIADANKPNFKAMGFATAESVHTAITDVNKANFKATGFATADSVHNAITDVNKANFKYGGGADSVRAYLATHDSTLLEEAAGGASNWSNAQRDSVLDAIQDANKVNFQATGFATPGDAMTFAGDSLNTLMSDVDAVKAKTDNLPTDPADDSDIDNQLSSIQQDLNNPSQYKATGFAVAGDAMTLQGDSLAEIMGEMDSVVNAIADANKPNFMAGLDSVNNAISDANKENFKASIDSMNNAISDANKGNFKATGFAIPGDAMTLQGDSLSTMMTDIGGIKAKTDNLPSDPADDSDIDGQLASIQTDLNNPSQYKADVSGLSTHDPEDVWNVDTSGAWNGDESKFGTWNAQAQSGGGGSSPWTAAGVDSVYDYLDSTANAIADVNKVNFKYGGGQDSVRAYLATHDSTLLEIAVGLLDSLGQRYFVGIGAYRCTVFTKLDSDSSAIPGVHVVLRNPDEDKTLGHFYSDANGSGVLWFDTLASGYTHKFWIMDVDYDFNFPESVRIHKDTAVTFYGSAFDYGDPPAENQCAVIGQIFDLTLDSLSGIIVEAEVILPEDSTLWYSGHLISPFRVADTTDVTGRWRLDLIPNSFMGPTGLNWYLFYIKKPTAFGGWIVEEDSCQVPATESVDYDSLMGR